MNSGMAAMIYPLIPHPPAPDDNNKYFFTDKDRGSYFFPKGIKGSRPEPVPLFRPVESEMRVKIGREALKFYTSTKGKIEKGAFGVGPETSMMLARTQLLIDAWLAWINGDSSFSNWVKVHGAKYFEVFGELF